MKNFAVFVATTGGPIQIERLTPESAPQSVICISGSSNILPMSNEYHDYIRRGSGIIEREFGPFEYESFRADVSGTIGVGKSWQLAFFLAHTIDALSDATLVEELDEADHVIWATGRVDYDLNILPVDHVTEKLRASQSLFNKLAKSKQPTSIVALDIDSQIIANSGELSSNFSLHPGEAVYEVCKSLGLSILPKVPTLLEKTHSKKKYFAVSAVLLTAGLIVVFLIYSWPVETGDVAKWWSAVPAEPGTKPEKSSDQSRKLQTDRLSKQISDDNNQVDPKLELVALASRSGDDCHGAIPSELNTIKRTLPFNNREKVFESLLGKFCRLSFSIDVGETPKYVATWLDPKSGRYIENSARPKTLSGLALTSGRQSWSIDFPDNMDEPFHFRLVVLLGDKPLLKELNWLKIQLNWNDAVSALAKKGIKLMTLEHRVNPSIGGDWRG